MELPSLITFQDAIKMSASETRHVLLGNGFSIDWKKDVFKYDALMQRANFSSLKVNSTSLFELLKTKDFEIVIDALRKASMLSKLYILTDVSLSSRFAADADELKKILASTIADNHPDIPSEITSSEYTYCRNFLVNFSSIYTLNYDLLLYWVLMHDEGGLDIKHDDGFRDSDDEDADYVVWDNGNSHGQNIHYLHGALHLFDGGTELKKFTWNKTGIKLIDQIRDALSVNLFPLIVTEGTSEEKLTKINHSGYLHKAKRSFSEIGGSLFIHGHSLADNDDHIISLIPETKINKIFISTMSDLESDSNKDKLLKIQVLLDKRKDIIKQARSGRKIKRQEIEVYFYKADSAHVWR